MTALFFINETVTVTLFNNTLHWFWPIPIIYKTVNLKISLDEFGNNLEILCASDHFCSVTLIIIIKCYKVNYNRVNVKSETWR